MVAKRIHNQGNIIKESIQSRAYGDRVGNMAAGMAGMVLEKSSKDSILSHRQTDRQAQMGLA